MNTDEMNRIIDVMSGEPLEALVLQLVFGFRIVDGAKYAVEGFVIEQHGESVVHENGDDVFRNYTEALTALPHEHYSTDLTLAFRAMDEFIRTEDNNGVLSAMIGLDYQTVCGADNRGWSLDYGNADTSNHSSPCLAICRGLCKAVLQQSFLDMQTIGGRFRLVATPREGNDPTAFLKDLP